MISYDPDMVQNCASRLYIRAALSAVNSGFLGCLIGLVAAPYIAQALPTALALRCPDWVFVVVLGLLGVGQGLERGFRLRLQAQTALCQLQIERNTRAGGGPGSSLGH